MSPGSHDTDDGFDLAMVDDNGSIVVIDAKAVEGKIQPLSTAVAG